VNGVRGGEGNTGGSLICQRPLASATPAAVMGGAAAVTVADVADAAVNDREEGAAVTVATIFAPAVACPQSDALSGLICSTMLSANNRDASRKSGGAGTAGAYEV
jgi:hypothetical protein